jgi:chromosome segregation protein
MLKALELSGFKSFADKTRFEFPAGITVVVGPNGSGKSNIVDAIKWVLGEQSAKSLRGKDMSDVIFKGSSGAGARRPANAATATIILDNADQRFAYDAEEVHVSRRVYRSGESEYQINGETSRLKDIRELFRGTGVGTDAYSLIEQGKVERLLQTSPKDRRAIFEEAAGISRFKAKKVEAQRRLARVEGNLIRLADIVEEVGSRYRKIKSQASKAARYKEYADRLQQLRTHVGLKDWRTFNEKLEKIAVEGRESAEVEKQLTTEVQQLDGTAKEIETQLEKLSTELNQRQETTSQVREKIAESDSAVTLNQQRIEDLEQRKIQLSEQFERATKRTLDLKTRIEKSDSEAKTAELNYREAADQLKGLEGRQTALDDEILSLRGENESRRSQATEVLQLVTKLGRQVSSYDTQVTSLRESQSRHESSVSQLNNQLNSHQEEFEQAHAEKERQQREAESKDSALAEFRKEYDQFRADLAGRKERLSELSSQHAGLSQRAEVIEELERSLEGINAGAKEILQQSKTAQSGPLNEVVGLVADLVSVNVQHAAIVDVALGELAQYVVVDGVKLINEIADERLKLNGRVGLIQLNNPPTLGADPDVNLNGATGVIGRTDRLVQVQPDFTPFIRQLLGGTWVVKTLGDALHLHQTRGDVDRVRLVTLDGEIVEADGSVVAGPKSVTSGLVSRRSELRALKREIDRLDEEISQCREQVGQLAQREKDAESRVRSQINENKELASRLADQTMQAKTADLNIRKTKQQLGKETAELETATTKLGELDLKLSSDRQQLGMQELQITTLNELISKDDSRSHEAREQRAVCEQEATAAKVRLAKAEQFLEGLQSRAAQNRQEFEEHEQSTQQLQLQREADEKAVLAAQAHIESGSETLQQLKNERDQFTDQLATLNQQRLEVDGKRRESMLELTAKRDQLRLAQDKIHQSEMRIEQINMQRRQLAERMQDDYGIDIASVQDQPTEVEL